MLADYSVLVWNTVITIPFDTTAGHDLIMVSTNTKLEVKLLRLER